MTDRKTDASFPGCLDPLSRTARTVDMERAIAAIVATTRREWMSPRPASHAAEASAAKRARLAHPLIRYSLDAKRRIV